GLLAGPHQVLAQRGEVAGGDDQLVGDDGVAGDADDPLDVAPRLGDGAGGGAERRRSDGRADDGDDGGGLGRTGRGVDHLEVDVQPGLPTVEEEVLDRGPALGGGEEDVEGEATPDDHLLHVVQLGS